MAFLREFRAPTEGLFLQQEKTTALVNDTDLGCGSLYITESCVSWLSESGQGFMLEYPKISLHAVARETSSFPKPCLYVMVDGRLDDEEKADGDSEDEEEDEDQITEVRFVPEDATALDLMHQAVCDGNILHPDPDDSLSDEDDANYTPDTGNGHFRDAEDEEEEVEGNMAVDTADAAQFENADEGAMS